MSLMDVDYLVEMQKALSEFDGREWYNILHRKEDEEKFAKEGFDCSDGWSFFIPKQTRIKKLKSNGMGENAQLAK